MISDEDQASLIYALLKRGVPHNIVAEALDLDPLAVKEIQSEIRISQYGTDELVEAMTSLMWESYDEARTIIRYGNPKDKMRFIGMMLGRGATLAGKSPPEMAAKAMAMMDEIRAAQRVEPAETSIYSDDDDEDFTV